MADAVYLGNPNLKKTNTAINFTKKQVAEFIKCKDDPYTSLETISRLFLWMKV